MLSSVEFHMKFIKKSNELFLLEKLRFMSKNCGGYFNTNKLTKNEVYNVLPKLRHNGWVEGNKVVKYRNILSKERCNRNIYYNLDESSISSLELFRGNLIAASESYCLHYNYYTQKKKIYHAIGDSYKSTKRYTGKEGFVKDGFLIKKFKESNSIKGSVAKSILTEYTGLSSSTIARWRKSSPNIYLPGVYVHHDRTRFFDSGKAYYSENTGRYYKQRLKIVSKINVFKKEIYGRNTINGPSNVSKSNK